MTSEDVIHDFGLPDFRLKHDVLPGRYETMSFTPDQAPARFMLYCNQFCGVDHCQHGRPGHRHDRSPTTSAGWR